MFRYVSILFCSIFMLLSACSRADDIRSLSRDEVYFFYQVTCPHCHTAAQYIKEKHPSMRVKALDVKLPGNMRLLQDAAKFYKIGNNVGTPLICFGDHYIMGWSDEDAERLDALAEKYE